MKQFVIIGIGNFGHYLAVHLYKKGYEVLVIDKIANRVSEIKDQVSQAVVADATDRKALEALGLAEMDAAVVCIGSVLSGCMPRLSVKRTHAFFKKSGLRKCFFRKKIRPFPWLNGCIIRICWIICLFLRGIVLSNWHHPTDLSVNLCGS